MASTGGDDKPVEFMAVADQFDGLNGPAPLGINRRHYTGGDVARSNAYIDSPHQACRRHADRLHLVPNMIMSVVETDVAGDMDIAFNAAQSLTTGRRLT